MDQIQSFGRKDGRIAVPALAPVPKARLQPAILGAILLVIVCIIATLWFVIAKTSTSAPDKELATGEELRSVAKGAVAQSANLVRRYPQDPRLRLIHGGHLADVQDLVGAEREYRIGLTETAKVGPILQPKVEAGLELGLVSDLLLQGRHNEAKVAAQSLCRGRTNYPQVVKAVTALRSHGICD